MERDKKKKRGLAEKRRSRRKSLRAPVYLDVRCDLPGGISLKGKVINLSPEGILIKTDEPISMRQTVTVEFLLPGTLNSIRLPGEAIWNRPYHESPNREKEFHLAGIKFVDVEEPYRSLLLDHGLKMLENEELLQDQGILQLLDDIRNLPPMDRLKAYKILIRKGSDPTLKL